MVSVTYFVVLPFVRDDGGELVAEEGVEVPNAFSAQQRAHLMLTKKVGAVAFSRTGDPAIGEFEDAVILGRYGETPIDLRYGQTPISRSISRRGALQGE